MVGTESGPMPWMRLDPEADSPLYLQLTRRLRKAILEGRVEPGTRLPSTRDLAGDLAVSRTTVIQAYERLGLEGYLDGRVGDGTYVSRELPESMLPVGEPDPSAGEAEATAGESGSGPPLQRKGADTRPGSPLSARARRLHEWLAGPAHAREEPRPFLPGVPDLGAFPRDTWARLAGRRLRALDPEDLALGDRTGLPELREQIARHLADTRGLRCEAEQVVVTSGAQQALAIAGWVLLDPESVVALEDPGYLGARRAFRLAESRLLGVPVDEEGLRVDELRKGEGGVRAVYVTPSRQFPTGAPLTLARRLELLQWAREADAWIIEDDYDGEYRFRGRPLQALHGLDPGRRVVYVGTFSKILFPSLRIGYAVVPESIRDAFVGCRRASDEGPSLLQQITLAEFMSDGHLVPHLRRMRRLYRKRRDALLEAVDDRLGDLVRIGPADAGMHVTLWLPAGVDDRAVQDAAAKRQVTAYAVSAFAMDADVDPGLVLGYAGYTPAEMDRALERLSEVVLSEV